MKKRVLNERERTAMREAVVDHAILGWFEMNRVCTPEQYSDVQRIAEAVFEQVGPKAKRVPLKMHLFGSA